jgi:hypothetical protein
MCDEFPWRTNGFRPLPKHAKRLYSRFLFGGALVSTGMMKPRLQAEVLRGLVKHAAGIYLPTITNTPWLLKTASVSPAHRLVSR